MMTSGLAHVQITDELVDHLDKFVNAVEYLNHEPALPFLKRLEKLNGSSNAAAALRERARECIKRVEAHAKLQRTSGTLLRPSSAAEIPADSLLRPVPGGLPR